MLLSDGIPYLKSMSSQLSAPTILYWYHSPPTQHTYQSLEISTPTHLLFSGQISDNRVVPPPIPSLPLAQGNTGDVIYTEQTNIYLKAHLTSLHASQTRHTNMYNHKTKDEHLSAWTANTMGGQQKCVLEKFPKFQNSFRLWF